MVGMFGRGIWEQSVYFFPEDGQQISPSVNLSHFLIQQIGCVEHKCGLY